MKGPTPEKILSIGLGYMASRTLLSAAELGVFGALARGAADVGTLERKVGLHPRSSRDFLDALVALRLLERENGLYSNSVEADWLLDPEKPSYIGGILEMGSKRSFGQWNFLTRALQSGKCQVETENGHDFSVLYGDSKRLRTFLRGMSGVSAGAAQALAAKFPWRDYKTFLDVGTAQGAVPVCLACAHAHLRGIGFDLPAVRPVFEEFICERGLTDRIRFQAGNFFEDELPQADVIVMGRILHDWDLEQKKALLAKAYRALPRGGAIVAYDSIIDDDRRENVGGLLVSLAMLLNTEGGFDYTGADCRGWLSEAGFSDTRVVPLTSSESMAVGIKSPR